MPDWLPGALAGIGSSVLMIGIAWGSITTRLARVEEDVKTRVTRELFDASLRAYGDKLDRIAADLERLIDRLEERTNPRGIRLPIP